MSNGLRGARIGVARAKLFGYSDMTDRIANAAIERMKLLGAVIVDPADIPNVGNYDASELDVLLYEFKTDLNAYLSALGPGVRVHSLADVIAFNDANRDREMPFFGQELMLQAQKKGPLTEKAYKEALAKDLRLSRKAGIDAVMDRLHLDADRGAERQPALDDGSHQRRPLHRFEHDSGRGRRLSVDHGACRICLRSTGWTLIHRSRVERGAFGQIRVRLRAGHQASPSTDVPADGRFDGAIGRDVTLTR